MIQSNIQSGLPSTPTSGTLTNEATSHDGFQSLSDSQGMGSPDWMQGPLCLLMVTQYRLCCLKDIKADNAEMMPLRLFIL